MEDRSQYLKRKLDNKTNLYNGSIPCLERHKSIYLEFVEQFKPADYSNSTILDYFTKEDTIISNYGFYVFFVENLSVIELNSIKIHAIHNFVCNWNTYDKYIYALCPSEFNHISVSTIDADDLYVRQFEENIPYEIRYSDIQFITFKHHSKDYMKEFYKDVLSSHISSRNNAGLITIILYTNKESDYNRNSYDGVITLSRILVKHNFTEKVKDIEPEVKNKKIDKPKGKTTSIPSFVDPALDDKGSGRK
ncbi:MAG: hypothetical protein J6T15_05250 [Bacilli bacterium]|nr:hypothetical protein [Bacilli bacterium]